MAHLNLATFRADAWYSVSVWIFSAILSAPSVHGQIHFPPLFGEFFRKKKAGRREGVNENLQKGKSCCMGLANTLPKNIHWPLLLPFQSWGEKNDRRTDG